MSASVSDVALAAFIAEEAGQLLLDLQRGSGLEGKALGALGDERSQELIDGRLRAARPGDVVLSEEAVDDKARLTADRVWIVDPLDGTREYGLGDRSDWAVHVALWERGRGITAAAVAQPALGLVHTSDDGRVEGRSAAVGAILVSDSRPPSFAAAAAERLGARLVPMGSAGAKAMAVVRGEYDAYVHAGGQWEWDSAAPVGVVLGAGLHASRVDGSPLEYNAPHPYVPDLVICAPAAAAALLAAIAVLGG